MLGDPVNLTDPLGLCIANGGGPGVNTPEYGFENCGDVVVTGERSLVWLADLGFGDFIKGGNRGFEPILRVPNEPSGPDIVVTAPRPKKLSQCMINFLTGQRYGAPNLPKLTFRRGPQGSRVASLALSLGYPAITIGNNVYVAPSAWDRGQFRPGTSGFFEEVIHSIQWSQSGGANFLGAIASGATSAFLMTGDWHDNPVELEAIAISKRLQREYANTRMRCP